jgi:hypothetical protein
MMLAVCVACATRLTRGAPIGRDATQQALLAALQERILSADQSAQAKVSARADIEAIVKSVQDDLAAVCADSWGSISIQHNGVFVFGRLSLGQGSRSGVELYPK